MYFSTARILVIIFGGLMFAMFFTCVVLIATLDDDEEGVEQRYQASLDDETLEEYWDFDACADLVSRIYAAEDAGASENEIALALMRAEGAVARYGVMPVLSHCETKFQGLIR